MKNNIIRILFILMFFLTGNAVTCYAAPTDAITIVIDAGHGGPKDTSADMGAQYSGLDEKNVDLLTAMAVYNELSQYKNVKVYMTRVDDSEVDLKKRVDMAKACGADVMVSIHYNASGDHLLYGGEAFVPSKGTGYVKGYSLAKSVMDQWKQVGLANKGIKTRIGSKGDYYGVIRHGAAVDLPVIILEHGYLDNYHDFNSVNDNVDWQRFGILDATGIANYYGLSKTQTKTHVIPNDIIKMPKGVVRDDLTGPVNVSLVIDSYNRETGEVKYTMRGSDPESRVMFFGVSPVTKIDETGKVVPMLADLNLWGNGSKASGTIYVPKGFSGPLYGICYNNYNATSETAIAYLTK